MAISVAVLDAYRRESARRPAIFVAPLDVYRREGFGEPAEFGRTDGA
jgi:hypothetical protein